VTLPKKPRELREDLLDLRAAASRIGSQFGPAYDYAYGLRRSGNGQVKVKSSGASDPTSSSYAIGGKARGLLRRCNGQVQVALRAVEAAEEALDQIYERAGPTPGPSRPATSTWSGRLLVAT
jgi:hypothetical protein